MAEIAILEKMVNNVVNYSRLLSRSYYTVIKKASCYINVHHHYTDVIMGAIASQITSLTIVYSTVYSGADQRKHQRSASLAFVRGIHRGPVNSPHKWPVTRKMFPFDDDILIFIWWSPKLCLYFIQLFVDSILLSIPCTERYGLWQATKTWIWAIK